VDREDARTMSLRIDFQDTPHSDSVKEECERWAGDLQDEFPEVTKFEVTLTQTGGEHDVHVHSTGKDLGLAARSADRDQRLAIEEAFEKLRRQLRRHHDKQIFTHRRDGKQSRHQS
jgi:ribosome-associated translation inhibitor RaiA